MGDPPLRDSSNWRRANGRGEAARLWWLPVPIGSKNYCLVNRNDEAKTSNNLNKCLGLILRLNKSSRKRQQHSDVINFKV